MAVDTRGIRAGDHVVQFYATESELAESVGRYVESALLDDDIAIVLATPPHRQAVQDWLVATGGDAHAARQRGQLVLLDAAETIAKFVTGGCLDANAFDAVVGGVVRRAFETGRSIRAYGEMVALLWDSGDVANAIAVESLWNDLALEIPFSLLCTYPHDSVSSSEHIEALHTICRLHSAVFEPLERPTRFASAEFALDLTSPRMARQFATQWLRRWGHGEALVEDATLLLSEVAANAVIHAHSPFAVEIHDTDDSARIAVRDHSTEVPATTRCPDMNSASGRGLQLVARIAHRWGVDPSIDGKTVWFELLR